MTQEQDQKEKIGNGKPANVTEVAMHVAQELMASEKRQVTAIVDMAEWFPPLGEVALFAPGLRWDGKVTKRWSHFFNKIYVRYQDFATSAYDKIAGKEYINRYPTLSKPQHVWLFMNEVFPAIVEATKAKLYELLPELKRQVELETKSDERKEFLKVIKPEERGGGRTSTRMRRQLDKEQYEDDVL